MSATLNGSSQYLTAASTLLNNEPIDMLVWGNSTNDASAQTGISLGDNGTSGVFDVVWRGNSVGDPIRATKTNDAGTTSNAESSSGYSVNTWSAAWAGFISNTSRVAGINGGSKVSDTTSITDPTPDFVTVGARRRSAVTQYFSGQLAEAYVLDINISDAQFASFGSGFSPAYFVPLVNIRGWFPLLGSGRNRVANGYPDLTEMGSPTYSAHPPKYIPPRINGRMSF
jgi:hypothetical protein